MLEHIVFIGPPGVPLEAVAKLTAQQLGLPLCSPNDFTETEWIALGWDTTAEMMAWADGGAYASYQLNAPVRMRALQQLMAREERSVIVLPPNYIVQEEAQYIKELSSLLEQAPYVISLIPSADAEENAILLDVDLKNFPDFSEVNAHFIRHPSNESLAKQVVYTEGKSREQTRDEILNRRSAEEPSDIILIGPKLAGKSTVGRLLADALGVSQVSMDMIGRKYLRETDFDPAAARQANAEHGLFGWVNYMRPYEAHIVEQALKENRNCVIDFGAGHSYYDDENLFKRVQTALAPYPNVFLILPSVDKETSVRVLQERFEADMASERKLHRHLVTSAWYETLANLILYTKVRLSTELVGEVVSWVEGFT